MKGFREVRGSYQNIRVRGQLGAGRTAISGASALHSERHQIRKQVSVWFKSWSR